MFNFIHASLFLSFEQNGFWLALGMCGVLMVPIIIFSVVTSHYYRRMKYEEDSGIPYESSFP